MLTDVQWAVESVKTQLSSDSEWYQVVSSAYFRCGVGGDKSLINVFQRRAPSTVPWETPIFIELKMDFVMRNLTHCSLLENFHQISQSTTQNKASHLFLISESYINFYAQMVSSLLMQWRIFCLLLRLAISDNSMATLNCQYAQSKIFMVFWYAMF